MWVDPIPDETGVHFHTEGPQVEVARNCRRGKSYTPIKYHHHPTQHHPLTAPWIPFRRDPSRDCRDIPNLTIYRRRGGRFERAVSFQLHAKREIKHRAKQKGNEMDREQEKTL